MVAVPKLTLVLPLKGRPHFTIRWLMYANRIELPFPIILADGSADPDATLIAQILENRALFPKLQIEYVRFPFDSSFQVFFTKMRDALDRVKTPFVTLADNDDFFVPEGLQKCLAFMESNPSYVGCGGAVGLFELEKSETYRGKEGLFSDLFSLFSLGGPRAALDQIQPSDRLSLHLSSYVPTHYDVHQVTALRRVYSSLVDGGLRDIFLAELYTSAMTVSLGPIMRLPELFLLRQAESPGSEASTEASTKGDAFDRMLLPNWSADFGTFVRDVARVVMEQQEINEVQAHALVKRAYRAYSTQMLPRVLLRNSPGRIQQLRSKIQSAPGLEQPVELVLRTIHDLSRRRKRAQCQERYDEQCKKNGSLKEVRAVIADKSEFDLILSSAEKRPR